ncbi:rRNA maturation RNase YbeY [Campylobacter corcagiensis]|uniref:Endoribonuclease YbeY n=1 Tax=Campylobacter corcagiensis TaxID=1448857 RepID=A0A7M1LH99_9BACT|nr:rRNA maturation RNase YbeY [Campylobacter corcagiensis]QKF64968.1 rRNA maturation RNase [Campylobacter corcagiensis]QOQ86875.1 rRNA maturation RNase YbeY [Campylobacter corcagiensis]
MINCQDSYPKILDEILKFLGVKNEVELVFIDTNEMKELNFKERKINKTTDVLSFPYEKIANFPIGSVVINLDMAKDMAKSLDHSLEDEIALLFTHGVLHILGFDHEVDSGQMRQKESEILKHFNLPKSLIVRTQDS